MRRSLRRLAIALLVLASPEASLAADWPAFRVLLDVSNAPDAGESALRSSALVVEWYPRINAILYAADHPLPFPVVVVSFEPGLQAPAMTTGNVIHVSSRYIKVMPDDFRAMLVHELTHVVQHYAAVPPDAGWVAEGMADYVRHKYFETDIRETLHLDAQGRLSGYSSAEPFFRSLQDSGVSLTDKGYLKSYTVASTFLFWLEQHKDKDIVHALNIALSEGRYSPELFQTLCNAPLDALWAEFVAASKS